MKRDAVGRPNRFWNQFWEFLNEVNRCLSMSFKKYSKCRYHRHFSQITWILSPGYKKIGKILLYLCHFWWHFYLSRKRYDRLKDTTSTSVTGVEFWKSTNLLSLFHLNFWFLMKIHVIKRNQPASKQKIGSFLKFRGCIQRRRIMLWNNKRTSLALTTNTILILIPS